MNKPNILDIINNPFSREVLRCTRAYTTDNSKHEPISYKLGQIAARNEIFLRPGHWTIASKRDAEKFWKSRKTIFVTV